MAKRESAQQPCRCEATMRDGSAAVLFAFCSALAQGGGDGRRERAVA